MVYLFETERFAVLPMHQAIMLDRFSRGHRLIVDTDGMYQELVQFDGYDFNHKSEADRQNWIADMDALGDRVQELHRFYHIPASNTALGHIVIKSNS